MQCSFESGPSRSTFLVSFDYIFLRIFELIELCRISSWKYLVKTRLHRIKNALHTDTCVYKKAKHELCVLAPKHALSNYYYYHYSCFGVRLSINRQNMNFGFWKFFWAQIIADYVYFHMAYHTFIWNHVGWHRRVLNMTHFQLFAWFGKFLLVKKNL